MSARQHRCKASTARGRHTLILRPGRERTEAI